MSLTYHDEQVYEKACSFIINEDIKNLPVNPFEIIKRKHWGLVTYSRLSELSGPGAEDIAVLFGSKDGFTIYNGRNYTITYNSDIKSIGRIIFTIMHEIAHIELGHFISFSQNDLVKSLRRELEDEANLFAASVLAPSVAIARLHLSTPAALCSVFGLSQEAALRRFEQFARWQPTKWDKPVEKLLDPYIKANIKSRAKQNLAYIQFEENGFSAAE